MNRVFLIITVFVFISPDYCISQQSLNEVSMITSVENGILQAEAVVEFDGKSTEELFSKSHEWVAKAFRNTASVFQAQIENEFLRISGISNSVLGPYLGNYMDLSFTLNIDFKNEKIRVKAYDIEQVAKSSPYTVTPLEILYDNNGKLKSAKRYKEAKAKIDAELTQILHSLISYLSNEKIEDEW